MVTLGLCSISIQYSTINPCPCTRHYGIKAKYKHKAKGIPGRQNGIYKGIEAIKGVWENCKLFSDIRMQSAQFGQAEGNKAGKGNRELIIIHLLEMLDLLCLRLDANISNSF